MNCIILEKPLLSKIVFLISYEKYTQALFILSHNEYSNLLKYQSPANIFLKF